MKQAVMVIHGMGEQQPMSTLRSFVEAVWAHDLSQTEWDEHNRWRQDEARRRDEETGLQKNKFWVVPDSRTGSYELRRISTPANNNNVRTDFYEFYWADLMQGTTAQHLWAWVRGLLFRSWRDVPTDVRHAWLLLWAIVLALVLLALSSILPQDYWFNRAVQDFVKWTIARIDVVLAVLAGLVMLVLADRAWRAGRLSSWLLVLLPPAAALLLSWYVPWESLDYPRLWTLALSGTLLSALHLFLVPYFGDVARYVRAAPDTVEKRRLVRERGIALLRALHEEDYRRIIVVSHSLGTIVAFDLLAQLWAEDGPTHRNPPSQAATKALEGIDPFLSQPTPWSEETREAYRNQQRHVWRALAEQPARSAPTDRSDALAPSEGLQTARAKRWLISDFVTLGSPLTHSEFLVARDEKELGNLIRERSFPTSPPQPDDPDDRDATILYRTGSGPRRFAHHGALFAAVRWTNIYDPDVMILGGDIISGPLCGAFCTKVSAVCQGIADFEVRMERPFLFGRKWRLFTHTLYWSWDRRSDPEPPDHILKLRKAVALHDFRATAS